MIDGFAQNWINQVNHAMRGSAEATARLQGMKLRAHEAMAAPFHFPYENHRDCSQWQGPNRRGSRALKAAK